MTLRGSTVLDGVAAVAVVFDLACGSMDSEGEHPDAQSEYVDLFLPDDLRVCGGQMESYDRFIESIYAVWADASPGSFHVDIHVGTDRCGPAAGCASGGNVYLEDYPQAQYHEIAHTVTNAVDGWSARVMNEGAASALGNQNPGIHTPMALQDIPPEDVFSSEPDTFDEYVVGGAFVRFAIEQFGSERVREYYRVLPENIGGGDLDFEDYQREFEPVFGETLDEAWTTFASEQRCRYEFWYCDAAQPEPITLPFALDHIDCDASTSLYFEYVAPEPGVKTGYSPGTLFRFQDVGRVKVAVTAVNVQIAFYWCGECSQQHESDEWPADTPTPWEREFDLEAGVKILSVRPIDASAPMWLEMHEMN